MAKPTGFIDYSRVDAKAVSPEERIKNFNEFHVPVSDEVRKEQAARCMDCGVPYCQAGVVLNGMVSGCPLNNLCPEWNDLLWTGNIRQAFNRLTKTNCFPEFTGRVCPALCEAACTCGAIGEPVTTKANELTIIEKAFELGYITAHAPTVRTGKKVAVVGAGPAGLSAAYWLNRRGHQVTVFERNDRPGGLLMYGIPNMKLEKHVIDRRVRLMEEEGIQFVCNTDIGKDISAKDLETQFDSVILACGAKNPRDIQAPGREGSGVYFAVDYLSAVTKSLLDSGFTDGAAPSAKDLHVVVIGGGDTGNDCVGTCIRQGCASVVQLEMMPCPPTKRAANNPWPEWPRVLKTDYGQEEAIACFGSDPRIYKTTVKEFVRDEQGRLTSLICIKLESQKDETTGRMRMIPVEGSEFVLEADLVLIAAGFLGPESYIAESFDIEVNARSNIKTAPDGYETTLTNVFAAGDVRRGQSLVVWAIREGREAARAVDIRLMGYTNLD